MTAQTLEDILITNKEIDGYMDKRNTGEHLKIKTPKDYRGDVKTYFNDDVISGLALPFNATHKDFRVRSGEVTLVTGYSGHGKSAWLNYVMLHLLQQQKAMIASFEMLPKQTLGRMCQQTGEAVPNDDYVDDFINTLEKRLFMYDTEGETTTAKKVQEVVYYCAEKLGVKLMVIDSLMKCGIPSEDYARQKQFVDDLCVSARDLGIHIFLVAHSRKTSTEDEGSSKFDVSGSSDITNLVDNILSVHRNKKRERELAEGGLDEKIMNSPPCSVYLLKQRHGQGIETRWSFGYKPDTLEYTERW
jgi:twinkle protein